MHYDFNLLKINFDLDFQLIDSVFCFMLRVFKLGRIESLKTQPVSVHSSLNIDQKSCVRTAI